MPRYIDADLLIEDLKNRMYNYFTSSWLISLVNEQPDIVRCKDCKHRCSDKCPMYHEELEDCDDGDYVYTDLVAYDDTVDDGFCYCGERIDLDD